MQDRIAIEIAELHVFFEEWLSGRAAPRAPDAFERLEAALAPDFELLSPDGGRRGRAELVEWLRASHGARRAPDFAIRVSAVGARHLGASLWLATYVEHHVADGARTARRSSAVIELPAALEGAPARPLWRHVHETWIEEH